MKQSINNIFLFFVAIMVTAIVNASADTGCTEEMDMVNCYFNAGELNNPDSIIKENFDQYEQFGIPILKCAIYYTYNPNDVDTIPNFLKNAEKVSITDNGLVCKFNDIITGNCITDGACHQITVQPNGVSNSFLAILPIVIHEKFGV